MRHSELIVVPLAEAGLLLAISLVAWMLREPLVFTSLGPTAYELIEQPERKSARPYNVIAGHGIAVASGFLALGITHAASAPVAGSGDFTLHRVAAILLAVALTVLGTLACKATQPAALSTTLLIALGSMQQRKDAVIILSAVVLLVAIGEPVRRARLAKAQRESRQSEFPSSDASQEPQKGNVEGTAASDQAQ